MTKVISVSLSPNTEKEDVLAAVSSVFQPWSWKRGLFIDRLERYFEHHFGFKKCISFNSGRSCLLSIFDAIDLKEGDEVIVQSYTCNAVINPILKMKAVPVYVDITSDLNIDTSKIAAKVTSRTKAIIAQHTFGMPCDIMEVKKVCENYGLIMIEDCAHAVGAMYDGKFCGAFGDFAFFSFGRDKVISSVYGGMLVVNNDKYLDKAVSFWERTPYPSSGWVFQQLLHPIITNLFVLPLYSSKIGKGILAYSLNYNILSKSVTNQENNGTLPDYFPLKMPNILAYLALKQVYKLERYNLWRKAVADYYKLELRNFKGLYFDPVSPLKRPIYMRFPLFVRNAEGLIEEMKKHHIYLHDGWRDSPIVPAKTDKQKMMYSNGICPTSEIICNQIVCLPTSIRLSKQDMKRVAALVKEYLETKNTNSQD
ncbi:MAG: DegT/DnrJ/EryC1/StrS family aminotransferase [Candidatus Pacebacteria bacterium]|nr:DegT/DnrJ/EryC1/StrS family aminotransferase [Candidatus Paceibacterota bacterium]